MGWLAGEAQAAERVYRATYEGSYRYEAHYKSDSANLDDTDTLSWSMTINYDFPSGRITRSLSVQGSYVGVNTGDPSSNYNCSLRRAPDPSIPINLFIGDSVDEVNVGA